MTTTGVDQNLPLRAPECEEGFTDQLGMKSFWSDEETRRGGQAPSPGKGRRFKSDRPHQNNK